MSLKIVKSAVADLPSFITDDDLACYDKYANKVHGSILDVGTGWGKSMVALAKANSKNYVYTVDPGITPIQQGWAKDEVEYVEKITNIIVEKKLKNVSFFANTIEMLSFSNIDLLHLDNWVELNQTDSSPLLGKLIGFVKKGGYVLFRNYGHGDRVEYTISIDKAAKGLTFIEKKGMIQVYQK